MMAARTALVLCVLLSFAATGSKTSAYDTSRPNIVIIMVDDMGFSDIGCYGSEIPTPNLDGLAANGLRFTQFYNTGRCCPTRASLLTGQYSHKAGIGHMTGDYGHPGYRGFLNQRCVTIADVAGQAGYFTAIAGKWHVGHREKSMWPLGRGFDRFFGVPEGGGFYFRVKPGRSVVLNDRVLYSVDRQPPDGWYSTDAWTDYGLKFVDEALDLKRPFLLYMAHNAPHFPLQARAEDYSMFRGKYRDGWDAVSRARYQRQVSMGLIDRSWKKSGRPPTVHAWQDLTPEEQDRADARMAAYAACVYAMDRSVGHLVAGLKERGALDNTLILFLSDNGGCAEGGVNGRQIGDPTTADSNWFCGESWAWVQDTPFRKYKHYNHEGGIASPLIAHWPAGIRNTGHWRTQLAHVIDLMATVVELTDADYPEEHNGHPIDPIPGVSLVPALTGQPVSRRPLFWEHEGNAAVRVDDWKLVRTGAKGAWELYDLKSDRTEQNNLAQMHPQRVNELRQRWLEWARENNVAVDGLPRRTKKSQNKKRKSEKGQ